MQPMYLNQFKCFLFQIQFVFQLKSSVFIQCLSVYFPVGVHHKLNIHIYSMYQPILRKIWGLTIKMLGLAIIRVLKIFTALRNVIYERALIDPFQSRWEPKAFRPAPDNLRKSKNIRLRQHCFKFIIKPYLFDIGNKRTYLASNQYRHLRVQLRLLVVDPWGLLLVYHL